MYQVILLTKPKKQLGKLPYDVQSRIIAALERIRIRPNHHIKRLVNSPYFSLRVGDYRVILEIDNGKLLILVIELGHRKNIYHLYDLN